MMRIPAAVGLSSAALVFLASISDPGARTDARIKAAYAAYETERAAFAAARNAEIDILSHAQDAAHSAAFARARNAEITRSVAAVERRRMAEFAAARNAEITYSIAAVAARHTREFVEPRNAEIARSMAAVEKRRMAEFVAARNAEVEHSVAAVETHRMVEFAAARNAEIEHSIAAVETHRTVEFADARNAEITRSVAAVDSRRIKAFAEARDLKLAALGAAVEARRLASFVEERNAEIDASVAAVEADRAIASLAERRSGIALATGAEEARSRVQTGSIDSDGAGPAAGLCPSALTPGAEACRAMLSGIGAIHWSRSSAGLDEKSRRTLDHLAEMANKCVGMVIEIHAHSDSLESPSANRRISERRARAVADYLISAGIDARRLVPIAHGADLPIAHDVTAEQRALNRRIEFKVRDQASGPSLSELLTDLR